VTVLVGCGSHGHGLSLSVSPASALLDTPFRLRVAGLRRSEAVTITVVGTSHLGKVWRVVLAARADARGDVDLRNQYLIARLRPVQKPARSDYLPWKQNLTVTARATNLTATAHARSILQPASVSISDERPNKVGFYGEWLTPRGARHHTVILLLGGSEGGEPLGAAAYMLAAHGYPVLALAYFREPGLPKNLLRIPLEYFQRALEWMRDQPEVDPQRIVTFGVSRGGELSLILASTFPDLVHGAVEYVGSNVVIVSPVELRQPAWTYRGKGLPPALTIPVERISGPVFAVGGGADALSSGFYIKYLRQELKGHDRRDVTLLYPHAGHLVGMAVPNQPELTTTIDSIYGRLYLGGSPQADESAREDSWPRLLRFLAELNHE
jgi:dienelactone hydrolase